MANAGAKIFSGLNVSVYRATGGKVGGKLGKAPILLLTSIGRKSGQPRTLPLLYLRDGDRYVIVASYRGAPSHPAWYHNLHANPDATIQVGTERTEVTASDVPDDQRDAYWPQLDAIYPSYASYRAKTSRVIPLVFLTPKTAPSATDGN